MKWIKITENTDNAMHLLIKDMMNESRRLERIEQQTDEENTKYRIE